MRFKSQLVLSVLSLVCAACATAPVKEETPDVPWRQRFDRNSASNEPASEPTPAATAVAVKAPTALAEGAQLNASLEGGTAGLGVTAEVGYGSSRFSVSLAPSFVASGTQSTFGLAVNARIFFSERRRGEVAGFARPELAVASTAQLTDSVVGGGGLFFGAEYLLNGHLGVSIELGGRVMTNGALVLFAGGGGLGVMIHP